LNWQGFRFGEIFDFYNIFFEKNWSKNLEEASKILEKNSTNLKKMLKTIEKA